MACPGAACFMRNRPEIIPLLQILYQHDEGVLFADLLCQLTWPRQELISILLRLQEYGVVESGKIRGTGGRKSWCLKASYCEVVRTILFPREGAVLSANPFKVEV